MAAANRALGSSSLVAHVLYCQETNSFRNGHNDYRSVSCCADDYLRLAGLLGRAMRALTRRIVDAATPLFIDGPCVWDR
jgi:hypothetical protein